jgi:hypothetical protein
MPLLASLSVCRHIGREGFFLAIALSVDELVRPSDGVVEIRSGDRLGWLLAGWLVVRTALWTTVSGLALPNVTRYTLELVIFGREFEWGYPKHPPLLAWLTGLVWTLGGGRFVAVYLLGYVLLALASWAVWRLGCEMVSRRKAFVAAMSLEGVVYYTYWGHRLDHNLGLTAFWALTILFSYQAFRHGRTGHWVAAGICGGLGLLAKYPLVFLAVPISIWSFTDRRYAAWWRRPGPYLAIAVAFLILSPHLLWARKHDWPTLVYAFGKDGHTSMWSRVSNGVEFLFVQGLMLLPLALIFGLSGGQRHCALTDSQRDGRRFLMWVIGGPVVLHLLLCLVWGVNLSPAWGMPFWTVGGLLLLLCVSGCGPGTERRMVAGFVVLNLAALVFLGARAVVSIQPLLTQFPGPRLAHEAASRWNENFSGPIPTVAGDAWFAGNIALNSPGRPPVYLSISPDPLSARYQCSAERERGGLRAHGGLVVWDADKFGAGVPSSLAERFPGVIGLSPIMIEQSLVGIAAIPPAAVEWSMWILHGLMKAAQESQKCGINPS